MALRLQVNTPHQEHFDKYLGNFYTKLKFYYHFYAGNKDVEDMETQ